MIAVIDYGMGNLRSVEKALQSVGGDARVTSSPSDITSAERIVLPGVGAFKCAMEELRQRDLITPILDGFKKNKPYLGICLGLQLLLSESEEAPGTPGLGLIPGRVRRFSTAGIKVPHMGWNSVKIKKDGCPLLTGIKDASHFYFVHSYYADPEEKTIVMATTQYGCEFASMIWKDNIFAMQFHPEKSQGIGLKVLENFVKC
ncbi:MAG: imidazole glycerol phosphate synthase subunit HisH [Candidatus Omnitrophica bacterium]|nr:imidazole glycerol phosphate synthase subunit HisH [Candidatus Omnitrophota bacterium]